MLLFWTVQEGVKVVSCGGSVRQKMHDPPTAIIINT